ncbi:MAG TPA: 4Fe-4S dicluster domain-containing protein [Anaerolineales bacterium]|nr:4Fe-4S dicluster domain-containing protein [Anaerolineales bacterium]
MNGFVVADLRRCIGCFACQAACVETHRKVGLQAYPRLIVTHTQDGTMPLQCRQCEVAACVAVCPVRALTYKSDSVLLNESLCIGCKMCALACPFGAIIPGGTPLPRFEFNVGQYIYVNTPYQSDPMYLRELDNQDHMSLLAWSIGQKTVAVKCDLCFFNEEGPACVIACPHKALSLVDLETGVPASFTQRVKTSVVPKEEESA